MKPQILLIDDDSTIRFAFTRYLSKAGYTMEEAKSLSQARDMLGERRFDAVLLDVNLPDGNGLDFIAELREINSDVPIVVITGQGDIDIAVEALRRGADHFLTKPVSLLDLDVFLRKSLELGGLRRDQSARRRLAERDNPWFLQDPRLEKIRDLALLAAENNSPVLLIGETGTGKGILAKWIHQHGAMRMAPFVEVNCSALRGEMLASELFGHTKGAFTSAVQNQQGLLDIADGGTLFLDEVGDMDLSIQTQFLKVIEEKQYRRLGEVKMRRSNFRLICATNRNLQQEIKAGRFRNDLYFRLHIFPIEIPPVRHNRVSIPELASFLMEGLGASNVDLPDAVRRRFIAYPWPGNIREMRNVLERALLLSRDGPLLPEHFPDLQLRELPRAAEVTEDAEPESDEKEESEAKVIHEALLEASAGLTRTEISGLFGHHKSRQEISILLQRLARNGLAQSSKTPTAGRPVERWFAIGSTN